MNVKLFLILAALFVFATPMFAQGTTTGTWVTGGLAMAIASGLCALGQGKAAASAAEAIARNPGAAGAIRGALLFGLVLIESLALYTLVIIFLRG
ncbi:MAG: ATP synthase F0 subunit C [Acidobacteria bacterium]|nr:ATP synthase F0 subunit C [Acidobacteriota bacterium]MBI3282433.1 ATP synthase F0 subunit C [Acidobacteriota bacterium]